MTTPPPPVPVDLGLVNGVIVADDDVVVRGILRSMLTGVGQDVFVAATGREAVDFASMVRASLILLDLKMPGLNGLLACEQIRGLLGYAATPIVILTAHDTAGARLAAERVGATLVLAKPFQPAALLGTLSGFLDITPETLKTVSRAAQSARAIAALDASRVLVWRRDEEAAQEPARDALHLGQGKKILDVYRRQGEALELTVAAFRRATPVTHHPGGGI